MILTDNQEDNNRFEIIYRPENSHIGLTCDLADVAWWKRPNLLATRYGIILSKYRSKMTLEKKDDGTTTSGIQLHTLNIHHLQSNDSGIYECETLGAIRQFNLTVTVRLTTVELGAQLLSSHDSTITYTSNQTDKDLFHQSSSSTHLLFYSLLSNNGQIRLRENQLIRITCVVSRALPAAYIYFPFDIEYRVEKNSTIENDDKTYRTILIITLRINRHFHQRLFHCEASQTQFINDENKQEQQSPPILSNKFQTDVVYGPTCSHKIQFPLQFFTGIHRPINLTCFMNDANPSKLNFTWILPNGIERSGYYLNQTASYITVIPKQIQDFGQATCRAQNEPNLFAECHVNMIMGGIPDPVKSCTYTYVNTTLTVNCVAGFHQGDEDFFCYMFKRQENGSFSEHGRLRGNCAFILPELKPEQHHDFRVFTKNKYGDNFDRSYPITVGKPKAETLAEKTRLYWPYMAICVIGACLVSLLIICCCCHQIRRSLYKRKTKGNFDSLTYQNHNSNTHANSNGKHSSVHLKQNGNGTTYPVRPYRSKDYLVSSETSKSYGNNPPLRSIYTPEEEFVSARRNTLKETDLDQLLGSTNTTGSSATATIKTLPQNRTRPLFAAYATHDQQQLQLQQQQKQRDESNLHPLTIQRRSSFQTATKLNGLDFYTSQEPFYLIDRQMMKMNQRGNYSPERDLREREHYREIRREYSPYPKDDNLIDMNRQNLLDTHRSRENSLIVDNHLLTNVEPISRASSPTDHHWREMNAIDEIDYHDRYMDSNDNERDTFRDNMDDNNEFLTNDDDRDRRSLDRISMDYRNDDNTIVNDDRDDDRYRDDGIFV
ncbi:unnamed protein product [Adineta steineri]|uniref:Ig-like domain-containing protein n=1 Tax=Adineta steineri TaxID=433720 RepID=A0A819CWH7_9BILA|nr:unnamed protein product [Adineta steineri]CAF3826477.1 unnamed protein product [Adineta steineri]